MNEVLRFIVCYVVITALHFITLKLGGYDALLKKLGYKKDGE